MENGQEFSKGKEELLRIGEYLNSLALRQGYFTEDDIKEAFGFPCSGNNERGYLAIGTIRIAWDNGSSLGAVYGVDHIRRLND